MQEELGVCAAEWTELGVVRVRQEHRHDTIHLVAAELGPQPVLKLDLGELADAQWFPRDALPVLSPLSREILRHLPPTRATA
jgi:8-oxo-dGTP pyrophosphatase MutT (NUDIX family)